MQAMYTRYWQVKQDNAQLKTENSRERSSKQRWRAASFLLLAIMAPLCCFGCNLVRVQQEVEWQLRVALMQSHADYQQATGTEDDPSAWMDAFPPQHLAGLSHRQQIILDQSLQALRRSSEQVADLSAAGWHKVCDLAGRAWDTLRTKWGQVLHQLSTRVSSTVEAAAAAALTAPTKAVNALQPYGLSIALDPKPQPQQQQQQQSDSMHRLAFHDLAWSSSRSQLWQQVSVEQPLGAAKQQSQQQWHQGMAAAAAASGSSPAATRKALAHIDATMAGLLADVTAVLQAPIARTTQSQSVTAPAPVAVRALPAGPQCQPPSLSDMLRCSSLPSAPAAVDCFWTPVATWTGHTVETVACETPKAAASLGTASVQHQGSNMQQQLSSAPAPASKRAKEWRLLPFLPERLAASARLLACATGRFQAGKLS